jgi:2-polyprenyl-6-methoxyphenol hydroxylase-like FAD-dependent oxidoreductase
MTDIAIVGAGVAGLASATLLARLGHRVILYERFDTPRPVGSGLLLQPPGLAALERLGLRSELEALGHRIDRLHGATATGTTIFDLAYGDLDPTLYALAVHRGALHQVLWTAFVHSGATLESGRTIVAVDARSGGRAAPIDANGQALPPADLIIDASGSRSPLRGWVARRQPRPFAYGAVWATVPDIGIAPATLAQRYVAARIMIGYLPVGRLTPGGPTLAAFFWSLKPAEHDAWRAGFAAWQEQVATLWPQLQPVLAAMPTPDDLTLASYTHFTADRVSRGNVVLIGDAAHATSPQLGQGANHGLIDAVVLADALGHAPDLAGAVALYRRMRHRQVRYYQFASAVMTAFFQSDSMLLAKLRDLSFDRMKRVPYLHREMLRTLAGLKTGLFTARAPAAIVDCIGMTVSPPAAILKTPSGRSVQR